MEATFELPIQSPAGDRTVLDRATPTAQPRIAKSRSSLSPKRLQGSSAAPRTKLGAAQLGKVDGSRDGGSGLAAEMTTITNSGGSLRELKFRRAAFSRETDRPGPRGMVGRPKIRNSPQSTPKPLLPATERKSQEDNKTDRLPKKDATDSDKCDIAPDGSSAGREGRQFTVANVGNNGRIYLKPTIRPAHLRFPQPSFVFPITPPGTAGLDLFIQDKERRGDQQRRQNQQDAQQQAQPQDQRQQQQPQMQRTSFFYDSDWTADQSPSPTGFLSRPRFAGKKTSRSRNNIRPSTAGVIGGRPGGGHRRAVSDSTVQDTSIARESEPGGFKIVITQPNDEQQRAKTLEDLDQVKALISAPHLEVSIPTWKLGTPRFSMRGTPVLRGSSYAPTEDPHSSRPSYFSPAFNHSHSLLEEEESVSPRQGLFQRQGSKPVGVPTPLASPSFRIDDPTRGMRATYHSNYTLIEPAMFDSLTFKPACDDRTIVRFSPSTLAITAATPPRLVAEITSPKFMDYDLVSDFFLTYRAFLDPQDLLRMLIARLRWAVARDDEAGMVVRVRTFVALRHWILNYFMDDFVIDYGLRVLFCTLLNSFVDELSHDPKGRKVQLKILTELKKCWRRSCAQYWDGVAFDDSLGPDVPISQGGIAGHRNPGLDPSFWEQVISGDLPDEDEDDQSTFLTHLQSPESMVDPEPGSSFHATSGRAGHIDSIILGGRPVTPEDQAHTGEFSERRQASPGSITSLDVVSCSFPTKNMRLLQTSMGQPLGAHPAEPSLMYSANGPVAMTPRALVGKRVRPSDAGQRSPTPAQQHRRNNSFSDSLREHASTAEKILQKNTELLMSLPYAGSLVRGAIFPPGQPYVDVLPPGTSGGANRQTTLFQSLPSAENTGPQDAQKEKASAMSSQGMRKLLSSVRRALSTRGQVISPTLGNFIHISPLGPRDATTNRLPGTAIVPQARPRMNGGHSPVRIDLLGAKIAEDFKIAVREDAYQDAAAQPGEEAVSTAPEVFESTKGDNKAEPSNYSDSLFFNWIPGGRDNLVRHTSDTGITTGSKSIVIVDGTFPLDIPAMSGALPTHNPSIEMFGETFLSVAADPTPPTTPPGQTTGTPRRSSYILGQHAVRPSLSMDPLPPFIPDLDTLETSSVVVPPPTPFADTSIIPSSDIFNDDHDNIIMPQMPTDEGYDDFTVEHTATDKKMSMNSFGMPSALPVHVPRPSWIQGHTRHRSSRSHRSYRSYISYKSNRSFRRKQVASFSSGVVPRSDTRSFDASTFNDTPIDGSEETVTPKPLRTLRRRPGGDLRAVTNVGDLDHGLLHRSRSVGSLTTYSESVRISFMPSRARRSSGGFVDVVSVDFSPEKDNTFSVGMLADKKPPQNRRASLFSANPSKPIMRPSFEAEAQKLAQIPDDDDDGGVESALLKLEGKFERKPKKLSFSEPPFTVGMPTAETQKGGIPATLSGVLASQLSHDQRTAAKDRVDNRHRQILNSDLAPSKQSMLSKLTATIEDADESQRETDEPRGSSMATSSRAPVFSPPPAFRPAANPRMVEDVQSFLSDSGESYSSIPLLDRGLTDDERSRAAATDEWVDQSILDDTNESGQHTPMPAIAMTTTTGDHGGSHPNSYEMVGKTGSIQRILPGDTMPQSPRPGTGVSFLDDESDHASDLSSEMSVELEEDGEQDIYSKIPRNGPAGQSNSLGSRLLPTHPLGDPQREPVRSLQLSYQEQHPGKLLEDPGDNHPPSPPITLAQALQMSPDTAMIPELHDHQLWEEKPLPPTPSPSGNLPPASHVFKMQQQQQQEAEAEALSATGMQPVLVFDQQNPQSVTPQPQRTASELEAARKFSVHLPFILAFESETLAQQFTLIEKDALHDIDWKELIEMRWKNAENGNARSWVDFLRNTDARGVEVVIARFNIMVKWAISEVILTQDMGERARCIIKFVHIAAHCRRYRNYATMSQIAIALTSNEVSRLTQTWAMVPPGDVRTLRELEGLVMPTRNFYNLRAEMEAVDIDNADAGCIPFVGIYTHDLLFNAQRPSEIASSPTTAPLVNFERCRFAASIVKTLLRLVEASALYDFQPIEGITERCLWMSALSDDDIRKHSEALE